MKNHRMKNSLDSIGTGKIFLYLIIISLLFGLGLPILIYVLKFRGGFSSDNADWGDFGLYLSGISGPFFSFASFVGLILTLNYSIQEKKDDEAQVLFFRYIDAVLKQNYMNERDAAALKRLYDGLCQDVSQGIERKSLPPVAEIKEKQNRNVKFFLLVYTIINYIKSTPKLDNLTYISILFSYLTYDEKFVFAVDMVKGRQGQNISQKLQQSIISTFMDYSEFGRKFEKVQKHI